MLYNYVRQARKPRSSLPRAISARGPSLALPPYLHSSSKAYLPHFQSLAHSLKNWISRKPFRICALRTLSQNTQGYPPLLPLRRFKMEQHKLASPLSASASPASPLPPLPLPDNRCAYVSHSGRRCRANSADPLLGLCRKHAAQIAIDPDSADLSLNLFGEGTPAFGSVEEINSVLTNLVVLVAQGRISSRRAGVIVYALSFVLRGLQVIDKKAADAPVEIIMDIPSAVRSRALGLAQTQDPADDQVFSGNR